jgi:Tol biopolymer transport system component/predicted Ser/Thr protein kinase
MTPERYEQISRLYHKTLEQEPEQRASFLEQSCGRDRDLRHDVEFLLASEKSAEAFFSSHGRKAPKRDDMPPSSSLVGRTLDNYQVVSLLGAGGMGEVYLARDTKLGREVAIKVMPAGFASGTERQRLEREARAASALNHPNILTIYEIKETDEQLFIAAEFVDGETLRERIRRGQLKRVEVLDVAIQVANALSAAHAAGIVHRDIKPENIMLRRDALVKVLDFGLAKLTDNLQTTTTGPEEITLQWLNTEPGVVLGTSAYMSPEQARGLPVDARSDIWSLGVVLYEMMGGRLPFSGATKSDVIAAILEREPPPLEDDKRAHAIELKLILHKALRKEREERYQTARELLGDLKDLRQEFETQTKLGRSIEHESSSSMRPRPRLLFALLLGLIIVAGVVFAWYKFVGRNRSHSVLPAARLVPFTTFPGRELQPTFSPDGNQIAFAWNGEKRDNFDIYVKLVDTATQPLRLTSNPADDLFPAWSPDGREIAFVRQSGAAISIFVVPALGGPERKLFSGTSAFLSLYEYGNALSWSPDGKTIAFSGQRSPGEPNSIFLLSRDSLETQQITTPPPGFLGDSTPAFSPDGKTLAFVRGASSRDIEIYVMPAAGGQVKRLTFGNRSGRSLAWTADGKDIVFSLWYYGNLRLWRVPATGGTPEQLAVGGEGGSTLAISRKGDRLAYSQESRDTDIWRVETSGPAGTRNPTRLISSTRPDYGPQYSPDGHRIAFTSGRSGSTEIWVCDEDGRNPVQLTSFAGPDVGSPRWSPDGRQIAFDSVATGNRDIYVISAEGGKPRRLTEDSSEEVRPSWSRDGQWIYFGSNRTSEWQVWKAPAAGGKAVQVTQQGGREAFESFDGNFVYYTRGFGIPGLWKVPVAGGDEVRVLDGAFQGFWALLENGIYFMNLEATPFPTIDFFDFATGRTRRISVIEKELQLVAPSLAVSPDGRWLLHAKVDQFESDIMLMENFH